MKEFAMNHRVIRVFIGYDPVESVAYHTLSHSILSKSTNPVSITPINLKNLTKIFNRPRNSLQSNEFSFSRFLVPYLCNYEGYAIFLDCDMLIRCDISEIFNAINLEKDKALYVVKHTYEPRDNIKYLNNIQHKYPRKNWSSVILWNCSNYKNKILTPNYVENACGLDLHRFTWLDDIDIGELDIKWNWLVGEYDNPPSDVKNVHWTIGGPYFDEYKDSDFSSEWFERHGEMNYCLQRNK